MKNGEKLVKFLKKILGSKFISFNEDHLGFETLEDDPYQLLEKTYLRIKKFVQQIK